MAICGKMKVFNDVRPFDFTALESFPDSEASRTEAARIRCAVNVIQSELSGGEWQRSFWNQGLRLCPCQTRRPQGIHYHDIPLEYERDWHVAAQSYFVDSRRLIELELHRKPVPAYKPLREQVVNGLVARTYRTSIQLMSFPCNWVFDTSETLMRIVAELYVVARWLMELGQDDDFKKYAYFSAGQDKLYAEHIRVALERKGLSPEAVQAKVQSIINSGVGRNPDLTGVQFGHWANKDTRRMCADLGCEDLYNLVIAPASWSMHGMYTSVLKENLDTCVEPLHGLHRLPVFGRKPPISQLGVMNAVAIVDDILRRWIVHRGGSTPSARRMPGYRFLKRIELPERRRKRPMHKVPVGSSASSTTDARQLLTAKTAYLVEYVTQLLDAGVKDIRVPSWMTTGVDDSHIKALERVCRDRAAVFVLE